MGRLQPYRHVVRDGEVAEEIAFDRDKHGQCRCGVDLSTLDGGHEPASIWYLAATDEAMCSESCAMDAEAAIRNERRATYYDR